MTIINTLKDTVKKWTTCMTTWGIQGAMIFVFLKKERSGHARKYIMSLFSLHFSYRCLVRFTSRGIKELQLIFSSFCSLSWAQLNSSSVSSGVCWALNVQNGFLTHAFGAQNCSAFTSLICQKSWRLLIFLSFCGASPNC